MNNKIYEKIIKSASDLWALFLDLIFPIECIGCGKPDIWLCDTCRDEIPYESRQGCYGCHREDIFGSTCHACREDSDLDGCLVAYPYSSDEVAAMIKHFKYDFSLPVGDILGDMLSDFLEDFLLDQGMRRDFSIASDLPKRWPRTWRFLSDTIIVSVPLHKRRILWRGFNQSEILAKAVSRKFGVATSGDLHRVRYTKPQAGKSKRAREGGVTSDDFLWRGDDLSGKRLILVDDVAATGATLDACAGALKRAGASQVWGVVLARG